MSILNSDANVAITEHLLDERIKDAGELLLQVSHLRIESCRRSTQSLTVKFGAR